MSLEQDVQQLRILVAELTRRVYRLEQKLGAEPEPAPVAPSPPSPEVQVPSQAVPLVPPAPQSMPTPTFAVRAPRIDDTGDLERRIGSQWLNRIGIIAVLIGASYFLKFAFDSGWIGPAGRVAIGLLSGIAIVFWSERFRRKSYIGFSYSLKAVGIGILYLSLWGAFQLYHLIPSGVAFFAMIVVTAATAVIALSQDAEILAALALVGGFITPALVSTGENHEIALFSYVILLDVAALVMIAYRPWRRLLIGSFFGTLVLYGGWFASFYTDGPFAITWLFATAFMLIFAVAPLVIDSRAATSPQGTPTLISVSLLNAIVYFVQVLLLFDTDSLRPHRTWVAVALAAIYIVLGRVLAEKIRREGEDSQNRVIPLLQIGIAVAFLTIAIPLKLSGHWITLGWLIEAAVLFWIGQRTAMIFIKVLALVSLALGLIRHLTIDHWYTQLLLFNERFGLYLVAIAVLGFMLFLQRNEPETDNTRYLAAFAVVLINALALVAFCWEVDAYWDRLVQAAQPTEAGRRLPGAWAEISRMNIARDFSYSAVWMFYGAALMIVGFWKKLAFLRWQAILLIGATIVKVFIYDVSALDRIYRILSFLVLGAILLAISFLYQRDVLKLHSRPTEPHQ